MDECKYIIYSTPTCPFCGDAVALLESLNKRYDVVVFENSSPALEDVKRAYEWKTVPMVFKVSSDGSIKFIGVFSDLKKHMEEAT